MSNQFKAGDLAILKSSDAPQLIGATVELVEYLGTESGSYKHFNVFNSAGVRLWWVRICSGEIVKFPSGKSTFCDEGPCKESRLMPLRGDFAPDQAKSREVPA
jgi:hypothetical protein